MLKLYLLRHGKAANPEDYADDFDRPLNKKGITQVNQVGFHLLKEKNSIQQIISSSAKRTEETALIVNHYLGLKNITFHKDLYLARHQIILDFISENAKATSVLYIGHNFGISDLAVYLSNENISMSTGMLVELSFDLDDWKMLTKGSGKIISTHIPDIYIP